MGLPFNQESWIWYTVSVLMIAARIISRKLLFRSWKGLQFDDWIMGIFVTATYTVLIVMSNKWLQFQSNLERPGFDFSALNSDEIRRRRLGSIFMIVVEQMQIIVIWSCKACLLIMYHRLTRTALRNENIAIRILSAYTAVGLFVVEILYFAAWCRPFSAYYAVPTTSSQCNTLIDHRITKAVFNISSDLVMLCIAIQMLVRSLLPVKRKMILSGIFSLGIFVVAASIMNSYSSFSNPYHPTWMFWYIRESSTAILVANLPFTWTILRNLFELGDFDENKPPPPWTYHSPRTAGGRKTAQYLQNHSSTAPRSNTQHSPLNSNAMTLVEPMNTPRPVEEGPSKVLSDEDEQDANEESIERHDFAPLPVVSVVHDADGVDLERGIAQSWQTRPISRDHGQQRKELLRRPVKVTEDGTGGFLVKGKPVALPPRTLHAPSTIRLRAASVSSANRRPTSPISSHLSDTEEDHKRPGSVSSTVGTAGGGRSARDRRARAHLSR
ncbi:hypothetical protein ACN47E_004272 [Coniothyrium glycines]